MTKDRKRKAAVRAKAGRDGISYSEALRAGRGDESLRAVVPYVAPMTAGVLIDLFSEHERTGARIRTVEVGARTFGEMRKHMSGEMDFQNDPKEFGRGRMGFVFGTEVVRGDVPDGSVALTVVPARTVCKKPAVQGIPGSVRSTHSFVPPLGPSAMADFFSEAEGDDRMVVRTLMSARSFADLLKYGRDVLDLETRRESESRGRLWTSEVLCDQSMRYGEVVTIHVLARQAL